MTIKFVRTGPDIKVAPEFKHSPRFGCYYPTLKVSSRSGPTLRPIKQHYPGAECHGTALGLRAAGEIFGIVKEANVVMGMLPIPRDASKRFFKY